MYAIGNIKAANPIGLKETKRQTMSMGIRINTNPLVSSKKNKSRKKKSLDVLGAKPVNPLG